MVPVSLGGSPFRRDNVQPAHRICNERKGNGNERKGNGTAPRGSARKPRARLKDQAPPLPTTDW